MAGTNIRIFFKIRINNDSMRTVAPIRIEKVIVDKERNEKDYFTANGWCTRCEALPLVLVSKGKTDKSNIKFSVSHMETILLTKNTNDWTNEEVMIEYLDYFRKKILLEKVISHLYWNFWQRTGHLGFLTKLLNSALI